MPPFLTDLIAQIKAIWGRLDVGQRVTIGAVLVATVIGIGAVVWYAGQPSMRTVLTATDDDQYAEAIKALQSSGIATETVGLQIRVDQKDANRAYAALRTAKVLNSSDGGSGGIMENMVQSAAGRRSAEMRRKRNEAAQSIMRIRGVKSAVVSASKPKSSPFRALDSLYQPRASVVVQLHPETSFRHVARAAVQTVSATIGMPPEFVTVINAVTQEQYRHDESTGSLDAVGFRRQERQLEAVYRSKAMDLLGPLQDKVRVAVTIVLDPEYVSTQRKYLPAEPVVREEKTTKEDRKGVSGRSGDPSSNSTVTVASSGGAGDSKKSTSEKKYVEDLGTVREGLQAPKIKMISFGLTVSPDVQDKVPAIINTVKKALAFGDSNRIELSPTATEVLVTDFPKVEPIEDTSGPGLMDQLGGILPVIGQIIGVVLVLFFLKGLLKKAPQGTATAASADVPAGPSAIEPENLEELEGLAPDETARRMRREIEVAINEDPTTISRMVENWLAEAKA